ncbi:MAG TPA: hypothetical protein VGK43_07760, partial [Solirubrobacterales bacterium]
MTPEVSMQEGWRVRFTNMPGIVPSAVSGFEGPWLHGRLETSVPRGEIVQDGGEQVLRRRGLRPAAAFAAQADDVDPIDLWQPFFPFGEGLTPGIFYLSAGEDFTKPRAKIEIDIALDASRPPEPTSDIAVAWEYWATTGSWKTLPGSFSPAITPEDGETVGPFLVDGKFRFQRPDDWTLSSVKGTRGLWLRARVTQGSFGSASPRVERLTLGDEWLLPRIDSLRVAVHIDRSEEADQKVPERGFSNQAPVDLSKDFLPFGEKPRVGDAFYLANEEAFSKPPAEVELHFTMTDTETAPLPDTAKVMLTWEYWNGRHWSFLGNGGKGLAAGDTSRNPILGFTDTTEGFTKAGSVSFTIPSNLVPGEVNGEVRRWVRARIAKGSYGVEARYTAAGVVNGRTEYQLTPATFKPPSLASVRLGYEYSSGPKIAQRVLAENDASFADVSIPAAGAGDFTPFVPSTDLRPTLYLGFERPGDAIGFANRLTPLFFQVSEALYDPAVEQEQVTEEASVVWEYWNGEEWERLGTRDETR